MATFGPKEFTLKDGRRVTLLHLTTQWVPCYAPFQKQVAQETNFTMQMVTNTLSDEEILRNWTTCERDPLELRLGAVADNKLVGLLGLHLTGKPHPWIRHIMGFGMMVLKEYWGTGLSELLLSTAEAHAVSVGIQRIEAMVRTQNFRGIAFYHRMGYVIEGTRKRAAIIDGVVHDEHYIAKLFG